MKFEVHGLYFDGLFFLNYLLTILILIVQVVACPYETYDEALITNINPIDISLKTLTLDDPALGDAHGFGFWSFCIPLWKVLQYPNVESPYLLDQPETGQLFFLLKSVGNNDPIMLGFLNFDPINLQVIHTVYFQIPPTGFSELNLLYSPASYEGKWIFTLITIIPQQQIVQIEMTEQTKQTITADFSMISQVQFYLGGRGMVNIINYLQITIDSNQYNLNIFKGRLSKIIFVQQFFSNNNNFADLTTLCQVPPKIIGEQTVNIVQGLRKFEGQTLLQFVIDEVGNRYCLSGWVKYDASKVVYQTIYTLLRLTAFKNYNSNTEFGDELFFLQVWLQRQYPFLTQIVVTTNPYAIPQQGLFDYDYWTEYYIFNNIIADVWSELYFQALQEWHFVQYEYGKTQNADEKMFLQIQFFNELGLVTTKFGSQKRSASFINSNFYLFFGGDDDSYELLQASIYNFKFEYNYLEDKQFLANGIQISNLVCHYSCKTCHGPLENNCIDCDSNSNRYYLSDLNKCKCQQNYIDNYGEVNCKLFSLQFQSVIESEIQNSDVSQCPSGYFQLPSEQNNFYCIEWYLIQLISPQNNFNDKLCVDCLYDPKFWYLKPICTIDLIMRKQFPDDAYTKTIRNSMDYDIYIIDETNNLLLQNGVMDFCALYIGDICHQTELHHLGIQVNILCKGGYYYSQQQCLKPSLDCLYADDYGDCLFCIAGMYLRNNKCEECPQGCKTCEFDFMLQSPICLSCFNTAVIADGQCKQCGSYCGVCKFFQDPLLDRAYLKCYKCVDDSKYMLSIDGINCLENPIEFCLYAFQALASDITINTLDFYFTPQEQSNDIVTYCGKCDKMYIFVMSTQICAEGYIVNCDFGFAETPDFTVETQNCLIQQYQYATVIQFMAMCTAFSTNCDTCLLGKTQGHITCLICVGGYYSEKLTGKCYKCPPELHCYQCIQQDALSKDGWKDNIRAFYRQFIENNNVHPFNMYGVSQNPDDYEVMCTMCQPGYEFLRNKCILSCPEECLECQLKDGQNICVKCQNEQHGRRLSLLENQCIQCPENCALCRQRSFSEIYDINRKFDNPDFNYYSHQCLTSFSNTDYYYDSELGEFIECNQFQLGCQQQFVITINLYCSEADYYTQLGLLLTNEEQTTFRQQNILITQLFSGESFDEFYTTAFYMMANQKQIKTIIVQILGSQDQVCTLTGYPPMVTQSFSKNIFSAMQFPILIFSDVQIEFIFTAKTIFQFDTTTYFRDFSKISISGLTFQPINGYTLKQLIFDSIWQQHVIFNNVLYQPVLQVLDYSQIRLNDLRSLQITNFQIINVIMSHANPIIQQIQEQSSFIVIQKAVQSGGLKLTQIKLENCIFANQIVFLLNLFTHLDFIQFENLDILLSKFTNSMMISSEIQIAPSQLTLNDIKLEVEIYDSSTFFDLYKFSQVTISSFQLSNSIIANSNLLILNSESNLNDIEFKSSKFQDYSIGILNSNLLLENQFLYSILNIKFENNNYDDTIKFVSFRTFNSLDSIIQITNLQLIGNYAFKISHNLNPQQKDSSVIYLSFLTVKINGLEIQRGYGMIDISFAQTQDLVIRNIVITQHPNFRFLGLHQYLDCQLKQIQGQFYPSSISIFSSKQTILENLEITSIEIYNFPLITIQSAGLSETQQQESLMISNLVIKENLLLLTELRMQIALFHIQSSQQIDIQITNALFQNNLLHEYIQNQLIDSAALLLFDCLQGNITIISSEFTSNLVTNSSDSIIFLRSKEIHIDDCQFQHNAIFNYQILQPFLLWGFSESDNIINTYSIQQIFPISSLTGNGRLTGQKIMITNSLVANSSGSQGGGFYIAAQDDAVIVIKHLMISDIQSLFIGKSENGGALYIDGSSASSLTLNIYSVEISKVYARSEGGFLYVLAGLVRTTLNIENIAAADVYAMRGSICATQFSNIAGTEQSLQINGFAIQNTQQGYNSFLNKFTNLEESDYSAMINKRTLFSVQYGDNLQIQNVIIKDLQFESFLYSNTIIVSIVGVKILNCQLSINLINLIANPGKYLHSILASKSQFIISDLSVAQTTVAQVLNKELCKDETSKLELQFFQCLPGSQVAPKYLDFQKSVTQNNRAFCIINKISNQIDLQSSGLIVFTELTPYCQFKLTKITLSEIDCKNCAFGLISSIFSNSKNILFSSIIDTISIFKCNCGYIGCIMISNGIIATQSQRLLQQDKLYSLEFELYVSNYNCRHNNATYGICLMIQNMKTLITRSIFQYNNATLSGGAIFIKGNETFLIQESLISENIAMSGGGLYLADQLQSNYSGLKTIIENNIATFYGNDETSVPSKLTITLGEADNKLSTISLIETESLTIEQIVIKPYSVSFSGLSDTLYLPSGQEIWLYQYFDWKTYNYIPFNWKFRLLPLNFKHEIQKKLTGTICKIQSRMYNLTAKNDDQLFTNNFTNMNQTTFNDTTQDYNLDSLVIYFDDETSLDLVLQLQFSCSSIQVPILNKEFPFNLLGYHNNYFLRLNIRSYPCQFGEIKLNNSCSQCDSEQNFFSLKINSQKCDIKDDLTTQSVKPAQLNIKSGYWRPYIDTSLVSYCLNLRENCLGGWVEGDTSCYQGHIGALCEQCDIYNIRGFGSYSISTKYSCGTCEDMTRNVILIGALSIWTLIQILISVKSTIKVIEQCVRIIEVMLLGLAVSQETAQSAILIKMLTNFLQIFAALSTFQLSMPGGLNNTIDAVGNPIQTMAYSLDCLLIYMFDFEIHYARMIWQLVLPVIYIASFLLLYGIGVKMKFVSFNSSVITTTLIYMYIYLQPNVVGGLVQLISFRKISDFQWISANVAYRYDTVRHLNWTLEFCLPTLLIIAFFIPLYMFYGLYSNRMNLDQKLIRLHWGYLYNEYKKNAYFWEIVKILEKELIIIFLTYYDDSVVIKAILILIIVFAYQELNQKYQPYQLKNLNNLDYYSARICIISIGLGIGVYVSQQQGLLEIQIPFYILLAFLNILFLSTLISRILLEYMREGENENKIDIVKDKIKSVFPCLETIPFCKRLLVNRTEQRNRIAKLYKKLKQFLLPQARHIIAFKDYQWELAMADNIESAQNTIRSPRQNIERQKLIRQSNRQSSLNNTKHNITSYVLETMKQKRIDKMAAIFEAEDDQQIRPTPKPEKVYPENFSHANSD